MPEDNWTKIIARSLTYLCLAHAEKNDAPRVKGLVNKVKFLQALGLSQADAAETAGSTPASIAEMMRQAKKKGAKSGKSKKTR